MYGYLLAGSIAISAWIYQKSIPKPLKDIPHNADAVRKPFGDTADFLAWKKEHGESRRWFTDQCRRLKSPIVQVFPKPFGDPIVILSDFREVQDLLMRRSKEFDRSERALVGFGYTVPQHQIGLRTDDPSWKWSREMMRETMTPEFINRASAPSVYKKLEILVAILEKKADIAGNRPVDIRDDVHFAILDAILATTFGFDDDNSELVRQLRHLVSTKNEQGIQVRGPDDAVNFPLPPVGKDQQASITICESLRFEALVPWFECWLASQKPAVRAATRVRTEFTHREIDKALAKLKAGEESGGYVPRTALEVALRKETMKAKKEGRPPAYLGRKIYDEIFGFILAGHDTSSATLALGFSYLRDNMPSQKRLRKLLQQQYFTTAFQQGRAPTVEEINTTDAPYLDAVVEETLRMSACLPIASRKARQDTTILGYHIPKGTTVFCAFNGPGFCKAPAGIPREEDRSQSSQQHRASFKGLPDGGPYSLEDFIPERWISTDTDGTEIFDSALAPMMTFGGGLRACFGRRMAYLQIRLTLVMVLWHFELLPPPDELLPVDIADHIVTGPQHVWVRLRRSGGAEVSKGS